MNQEQYERVSGNEANSEKLFCYTNFLNIEIHRDESKTEFYMVYVGNKDHETYSLEDAEKFLYENMKSELPKKKKKEKIDSVKMPRGLSSYLDTYYQIVEYMGYNQKKYQDGEVLVGCEGLEVIEELDGQAGKQEFAEDLTTKFETKIKDFNWEETDYFTELDEFLRDVFRPKKTYTATARVTTYATMEIKATSQEEAQKIAYGANNAEFTADDGTEFEVFEIIPTK
jgi:hypothetical protein